MTFYRGFIIWGLTVLITGILCFSLWKFYFCRLRGFENRTRTTLFGCILIFITTISFLFLPLVLCKAPSFTRTKNRFVDGIKNDIVAKTRDAFYEDAEEEITEVIDLIINNDAILAELQGSGVGSDEIARAKENVIKYAIKYSKNRTLKDSISNALKLLKVGNYNIGVEAEDLILQECNRIVNKYSKDIRGSYIKNNLMRTWVAPIVNNVSMEDFTGIIADEAMIRRFNKAKDAFDKLFLILATCLSLLVAIVIILILFMLREPEDKIEASYKRNYMFEYNEKSLIEMNTKKV